MTPPARTTARLPKYLVVITMDGNEIFKAIELPTLYAAEKMLAMRMEHMRWPSGHEWNLVCTISDEGWSDSSTDGATK